MRHDKLQQRLVVDEKQRLRRNPHDDAQGLGIAQEVLDDLPRRFLLFDRSFDDRGTIFIHRQLF